VIRPGGSTVKTRDGRRRTDYALEGSWGQLTIAEMGRLDSEVVVRKQRPGAFHRTNLDLILQARGIQAVAIAGTVTQGCVLATAYEASFRNYYTVVVGDAVTSHDQELHATALRLIGARYDVVDAAAVEELWRQPRGGAGPGRPGAHSRDE